MARFCGICRSSVALATGLKRLWLAAHRKDLKGKSPVLCRKHRNLKVSKALAQSLLHRKPHPPNTAPRQKGIAMQNKQQPATDWAEPRRASRAPGPRAPSEQKLDQTIEPTRLRQRTGARRSHGPFCCGGAGVVPRYAIATVSRSERHWGADERAASHAPAAKKLRAAVVTSLNGIAAAPNGRGAMAPRSMARRRCEAIELAGGLKSQPMADLD